MSSHTVNSWKKYCLHRKDAIEDLRKRAISNAEKKAAPEDMDATEATGIEAIEPPFSAPQQAIPQQTTPQQTTPQQATPQQATPQQTTPQQAIPRQTTPQQATPRRATPQRTTPQLATPQQVTNPHESQPPPPPYEKVAEPEPVLVRVKSEPLDEDQLDFAFATNVLSGWNANEESDAALWKRMESMVCSMVSSSGYRDG